MSSDVFAWPDGAACAVSLCYDDSCPVHYEVVAPTLERHGLRGTFYVTVNTDPLVHPERWRDLASRGHELGNHTLFHPCRREPPEAFGWLDPAFDLADYSPARFEQELRVANLVLHLLDGKHARSFGNTCCHDTIGRGAAQVRIDDILAELFVVARGPRFGICHPSQAFEPMRVGQLGGDGRTCTEIRTVIEQARDSRGWANYLFHGVGAGSHSLFIDAAEHAALAGWLAENRSTIWVAPAVEIGAYVRAWQDRAKAAV